MKWFGGQNIARKVGSLCVAFAIGCTTGCELTGTPKRGTELALDADEGFKLVTYVSPEEYERMTPQERERLNATVGGKIRMGKRRTDGQCVSEADFRKAMEAAKQATSK